MLRYIDSIDILVLEQYIELYHMSAASMSIFSIYHHALSVKLLKFSLSSAS